eukprot:5908981-Prymnesium_polylepis.1
MTDRGRSMPRGDRPAAAGRTPEPYSWRTTAHARAPNRKCSTCPRSQQPRRYTVSAVSRCICAVSVLYLALYFWDGGASEGS